MKIANIRAVREGNNITIFADCKIRPVGTDTIYFQFDKKYEPYLAVDASPFVAGLLVAAMHFKEDIFVEGQLSETLYRGIERIMETMLSWRIGLHPIHIQGHTLVKDDFSPAHVATFFSGGVDSFYTYLNHKDDAVDPIDHFILINGNDIVLGNEALWSATQNNVHQIAAQGSIAVIEVETNLQALLEPMLSPDYTHGGTLAAVGLCLRKGIKKLYIPASFEESDNIPWGSHPAIDGYWSTETTSFVHDGADRSRFQKTDFIARFPIVLDYVRVCYKNNKGQYNCGACEKCVRTMIGLYAAGKLDDAKTFPHTFDLKQVTRVIAGSVQEVVDSGATYYYAIDAYNLDILREKNLNPQLQKAILEGLKKKPNRYRSLVERCIKKIIFLDHRYARGFFHRWWLKTTSHH